MQSTIEYLSRINDIKNLIGSSNLASSIAHARDRALNTTLSPLWFKDLHSNWNTSLYNIHALSSMNSFSKIADLSNKFRLPTSTFDFVRELNQKHEKFFGSIWLLQDVFKVQNFAAKASSLYYSFDKISAQLAGIALREEDADLLEDFEQLSNEAVSISDRIEDENGISSALLLEIRNFMQQISLKVENVDANVSSRFVKLMTIIGFFLALLGEARNWLPKPNYATKEELENVVKGQYTVLTNKLKEQGKDYKITKAPCLVKLKPKKKSLIILKLSADYNITVLNTNHEWAYISFLHPDDNLPMTGWVLKKYLKEIKK